ncbi:MAG: response regulator [Bacteroidales bacterium]|nr:response regulator [Bacteroidales bacterium]MDT8430441.1 response regulator [Bacteroidales bacterium]
MSDRKKILVCEDNKLTQRVLEVALKSMDHEILVATDGEEGIRLIKEHEIGLIITDINMPYNSGLEIVAFVRKNYGRKIPVIIVTNISLDDTRKHAKELGADAYITKPFDPDQLLEIIQSLNFPV